MTPHKKEYQAYKTTTVPVEKTMGAINELLYNNGCQGTRFTNLPTGFTVEFMRSVKGQQLTVSIPVQYSTAQMSDAQKTAHQRMLWRSVFYFLKAQFDAIEKGITPFEETFLANIVVALPDGTTGRVKQVMLEPVMNAQKSHIMLEPPKTVEYRRLN